MLFLRKIAIFALRITGRRVGDGPGEMPEWSIGPHSKCGVRATVPGVRIPLSPQTTGWSAGLKHSFATFFIFGVDKFIRSGLKIKVGRMAGRRKSGVRKVAPVQRREGRAACGNAKSSGRLPKSGNGAKCCTEAQPFCVCNAARSFEWTAAIEWPIRFLFRGICNLRPIGGEAFFVKLIRNP